MSISDKNQYTKLSADFTSNQRHMYKPMSIW